ncbi:MAG: response regulator, partial [Bacteroidaceae bacterium]|nr:response regulator [Bacteroidaceae bacterium]
MQAGKSIEVETDIPELIIPIDKEEVTKVLSNLLNNGLKYATQNIKVKLTNEDDMALISVYSDGNIIPSDMRKRIFDPFYQLDEESSGVGLGLSLARSIVELHKGYLSFDVSDDGKYNIFTCALPCTQTDVIVWETTDSDTPVYGAEVLEKNSNLLDMSGCSVLVVDDNPELLAFLVDRLNDKFTVHQAHDGEEALEVLSREVIHIVVSDVMMPRMDGFELCRRIKSIPEYNHIPVLLLSAQTDMKSKLYGLEQGADAYIEKPFSFAYLIGRVNNLLANRQIEREALIHRPIIRKMGARHNKADEELMQRIVQEVQMNMHDESFNVEKLASNLNMSRTVLHRKVKSLFDLPPVEYIRIVRLQRAAELLIEGNVTIAEAGAMVGINTPSYFSRLFQKQFGVTPKVFVIQQREKNS